MCKKKNLYTFWFWTWKNKIIIRFIKFGFGFVDNELKKELAVGKFYICDKMLCGMNFKQVKAVSLSRDGFGIFLLAHQP